MNVSHSQKHHNLAGEHDLLTFLVWLVIAVYYYFISRYEEKLLIKKYGDKYKEYQKKVPMFIPFIK